MKVQVLDDAGRVMLDFDPEKASRTIIDAAAAEKLKISNALCDALNTVNSDKHLVASISGDIRNAIERIETELGAHPAFTWAQTRLANAIGCLESYVAGIWSEPIWPQGYAQDERGMFVPTAEGVIASARPDGKGPPRPSSPPNHTPVG